MDTHEADLFDVGVDKELSKPGRGDGRAGAGRGAIKGKGGAANHKRQKKDEKFGFGGRKKNSKSGDAMSSADLSGFNAKKMKAGGRVSKTTRPGKARRKAMSGR
jgi:rRNA-processing protein EBP2